MEQLALMYHDASPAEIQDRLRLGHVILLGSDLDRHVFANYLADGVLNVPEHLSVYISASDKALGFARRLTRRDRLGQLVDPDQLGPQGRRLLTEGRDQLSVIDVSDAEGAAMGKGHAYFRDSPWVSSDVLMTLVYGLTPEERGLQLKPDMPVYEFPPDYLNRLWVALARVDPGFQRAYERRETQ